MNPQPPPIGAYREQRTGIVFPPILGDLKRDDVQHYSGDDKAGVAIAYGSETIQATIYVCRREGQVVPDGADSLAVRSELENSLVAVDEMESRAMYKNVKKFGGQSQMLGTSAQNLTWSRAAFTARTDLGLLISFIYITGAKGHIIKLRVSIAHTIADPENPTFPAFLSALGDLISKR